MKYIPARLNRYPMPNMSARWVCWDNDDLSYIFDERPDLHTPTAELAYMQWQRRSRRRRARGMLAGLSLWERLRCVWPGGAA